MSIQKKSKITISEILSKKKNKEKITMLTSYDYCLSRICNETNLDMVLIGDSAATVMMGYNSTRKIGMTEMLTFCKGVVNAITRQIVIAEDRKSTRLNSSHSQISYAVFCLKKKKK